MDGTITRSRSLITQEMKEVLGKLPKPVVVISGASYEQIEKQLDGFPALIMAQNGNDAFPYWEDRIEPPGEIPKEIMEHIHLISQVKDDMIEHRGCQISLSFLGHHAPISEKEKFDPDKSFRTKVLQMYPFKSENYEVKIAGTTCLDYFKKGHHKGYNIEKLIKTLNLKKKQCLYIGDALFPGGNDESVIGVIETKQVENPQETYEYLVGLTSGKGA